MAQELTYVGEELDLFAHATRWKNYWSRILKPYLGKEVLEVGAGLGVNTPLLLGGAQTQWLCLEPDPTLAARLEENCAKLPGHDRIKTQIGIVSDLPPTAKFDTILYIDVLEHIEHDAAELKSAALHLHPGGRLIVLSPAHQFLFSPFDQSIGHFRRYSKATLAAVEPSTLHRERLFMLDSVGMLASLANRLMLKQKMPTREQIDVWNNYLVPVSERVDPLLGFSIGKTVIGIWQQK